MKNLEYIHAIIWLYVSEILRSAPNDKNKLLLNGSIVEKFEGELESDGVELSVHGTDEYTGIEDVRTDAIPQLDIRMEVRHEKGASIQTFVLYHPQPTVEGTQDDER